ncbi:hypothetical protein EIO_2936 (plasmid) [Ketogulonicigenium vulgare Y25]|nr:hypothetical protein EIO_2936 [Ketogulonicigenium vulgare Y25]
MNWNAGVIRVAQRPYLMVTGLVYNGRLRGFRLCWIKLGGRREGEPIPGEIVGRESGLNRNVGAPGEAHLIPKAGR